MALAEHNNVVKAFPADRTDQPFSISIFPRRARRRRSIANSRPIAKEPKANQRSGFSDLGIEASHQQMAHLHGDNELCGCLNHVDSEFTGTNAHDGSAMPRRVADPSACVWPVKCGVMFLDVVEIDGAEGRRRLL